MQLPPTLVIDQVDSTNSWLAKQWRAGKAELFSSVRARSQTEGRGRFGRKWEAPRDGALLYSAIVAADSAPTRLPLGAAIAVKNAIDEEGLSCKWPNDILLGGRKVAGILAEHLDQSNGVHTLVLGIGINLSWCPDYAAKVDRDPDDLAARITAQLPNLADLFEQYREQFVPGPVKARTLDGKTLVGRARGVDSLGGLNIEIGADSHEPRIVTVTAGDVTFEENR